MKVNESLQVTKDFLGLIISNAKSKIAEKHLIQKKLTPFLFHKITRNELTKNIEGMEKIEEKKSFIVTGIQSQPLNVNKDNMNPKDIKISNRQISLERYSNIERKNIKNTRKRYQSALQTNRQRKNEANFSPKRPITSSYDNPLDKDCCKFPSSQRSTRTDEQSTKTKFPFKVYSISLRTSSKKQSQFIKLSNIENPNQKQNLSQSIEEELRKKKHNQQVQRQIHLQEQEQRSERKQRLIQAFHEKFQNGEGVSFDFDGTIFDFNPNWDQLDQEGKKLSPQSKDIGKVSLKQNNPLSSTYRFLNNQRNDMNRTKEEIYEAPLIVNTKFKITSDVMMQTNPNNHSQNINRTSLDQSTSKQSSFKTVFSRNPPQTIQTSQSLKNESSKTLKQSLHDNHVQNEHQFTNNYRRQTSIIPYLEIKQGVCYKEELKIQESKVEPLIQYASVSKQNSNCNKDYYQTMAGSRTFRSYLSFKKPEAKPIQSFNITFSDFAEKNQSVKSSRIKFNLKTPQQKSSRIQNSIKMFTDKNPFINDQDSSNEKNSIKQPQIDLYKVRPKTTRVSFKETQTKMPNQTLQNFKNHNTQSILDHKAKIMMKQKLQKSFFQFEEVK